MYQNLTKEQQVAYDAIISNIQANLSTNPVDKNIENRLLSLSGAAGTGKSFLTVQLIKRLSQELAHYPDNKGICVTAPTHKAVKVLEDMLRTHNVKANCRTIHSFFNLKPVIDYDNGTEKFTTPPAHKQLLPKVSLLIVDESSMVSDELNRFIIKALKDRRVNTVLFIGDKFQLLPVSGGENKIFNLKNQYHLTEVVRQAKDSNIIKLATKIRQCIENKEYGNLVSMVQDSEAEDIELFHDKRFFLQDYCKNNNWHQEDKIVASYTNKDVDLFNDKLRRYYWKQRNILDPQPFLSGDKIRFKSAYYSQRPYRHEMVVFQNDEEVVIDKIEYVQSQTTWGVSFWKCTVAGTKPNEFFRILDDRDREKYHFHLDQIAQSAKAKQFPHKKNEWQRYYKEKNSFADVQYTHATTIHKLQGSTYDTAYIDISSLVNNARIPNDLKYRLLYVAVTRARKNIKILY